MRLILFLFISISLLACQKKAEQQYYIEYQVSINNGNSVNIYCLNDYYYESGFQLKKINYKSDLNYFSSTHLADENEAYYLRVEPDSLIDDTVNISAVITVNDSVVKYFTGKTFTEPIVLWGNIK